jgi:hypothetical protein
VGYPEYAEKTLIGNIGVKYLYKLIMRKGFNFSFCNYCLRGLITPFKLLLRDSRVDPSNNDCEGLKNAYSRRHHQIMEIILLDSKIQPICSDLLNNVYRYVISNFGYCEFVKNFLQDSRYNALYNDILLSLHSHIDPRIYQLLLNHPNIDPSSRENAAIICASSSKHTSDGVVELLLLDPRVNPADWNNYAVIACARGGKTRNLKLLLEDSRIDPTVQDCRLRPGVYDRQSIY